MNIANPLYALTSERRRSPRVPIQLALQYQASGRHFFIGGGGHTIDISSRGVLFTTQSALQPGDGVELMISWPVSLDDGSPLSLVVQGRVARSVKGMAAVLIAQHRFRAETSPRAAALVGIEERGF